MNTHPLSFSRYLAWLFQKYQDLKQESQITETYRIIDVLPSSLNASCKLKIQVIGTDKIVDLTPEHIVKNNHLLEGFSKLDVRTITYHACEEMNKPTLTLLSHSFSDKLKRILFRVKNRKTNQTLEKTASDFLLNKDMTNQLSSQDALCVGYLGASEEADREREALAKLKEKTEYPKTL